MADTRFPFEALDEYDGPGTPPATDSELAHLPLLDRIAYETRDRDYDFAAQRKAAAGSPKAGPQLTLRLATLVAVGVVSAVAVTQTTQEASDSQESRPILVERVQSQRETLASTQEGNAGLRAKIAREGTRAQAADSDTASLAAEGDAVAAPAGYAAVTGPGLTITVASPTGAAPKDAVRDADLALLVNGLWTAGGEAIAINGQRLTALTYIKNSGDVVHVNSRPLTEPYTIEVIGDPQALSARLLEAPTGARFLDYARLLDFTVTQKQTKNLSLPALRTPRLRSVRLGVSGDVPFTQTQGVMP